MGKQIAIFVCLIFAGWSSTCLAGPTYDYPSYRILIGRQDTITTAFQPSRPAIGIISHHLPVASPLLDHFYGELKRRRPAIKTFVVIGPDHFERCRQKFVLTPEPAVGTMFGELPVDQTLAAKLQSTGVQREADCFYGEHAIGVEANYIKKYFPQAKIVPVLLSYAARTRDFGPVIKALADSRSESFVLASLDFSHYIDAQKAAANDQLSRCWLMSLNGAAFSLKQVDSPGTLRLVLGLAKELRLKPQILEHRNSYDYTGIFANTTSYFSVMF